MKNSKLFFILIIIIAAILILLSIGRYGFRLEEFQAFIKNLGYLAPFIFIIFYSFAPTLFMPITPLSITAGVLFGPVAGTFYSVVGATLGASVTFLVSRYLLKDFVDKYSHNKILFIKRRVEKDGWKFIAISRITPIFPFNIQNYIFGLTEIKLSTFFITSLFSLIPGSFFYVYLGYTGSQAVKNPAGSLYQIIIAVILSLILFSIPYLIKKTSQIIARQGNKTSL